MPKRACIALAAPSFPGKGLNQEVAETDDFLWVFVSRDTRWVSYAAAFLGLDVVDAVEGTNVMTIEDDFAFEFVPT